MCCLRAVRPNLIQNILREVIRCKNIGTRSDIFRCKAFLNDLLDPGDIDRSAQFPRDLRLTANERVSYAHGNIDVSDLSGTIASIVACFSSLDIFSASRKKISLN